MKKIKLINMTPLDLLYVTSGCAIYGIAVNIFIIPNNIAPGGATGTSVILNHFTGISVGTYVFILNLPLFLISIKAISFSFFKKTLIATFLFSAFIDIFSFLPAYNENKFLAAIFGGALGGLGMSFVFSRGIMTGGSDLLARLIRLRLHHVSLGRLILIIDAVVIISATITFKNITEGLLAVISIFVLTKTVDSFLIGLDRAKAVMVITEKAALISSNIISSLGRTSTKIPATGGYSEKSKDILLCTVRRYELYKLITIIKQSDDRAFFLVFDTGEVYGEGFKPYLNSEK